MVRQAFVGFFFVTPGALDCNGLFQHVLLLLLALLQSLESQAGFPIEGSALDDSVTINQHQWDEFVSQYRTVLKLLRQIHNVSGQADEVCQFECCVTVATTNTQPAACVLSVAAAMELYVWLVATAQQPHAHGYVCSGKCLPTENYCTAADVTGLEL